MMRQWPRQCPCLSPLLYVTRALLVLPGVLFGFFAAASIIPPSQMVSPVRIRVRLAEALPTVSVRGFDLEIQEGPRRDLAATPDRASEWEFRCEGNRVRAVSSHGKNLDLSGPVTVFSRGGMLRFREKPYREELKIYPLGSLCEVVNVLDIEKYLDGLVNAEFSSRWNEQAVKAQVIAARTYGYYQIRNSAPGARFDVDATIRDQVYDGYVSEDFKGSRAVDQTRGIVLTSGHQPIKAFYHSSCAGRTELPENVFGDHFAGFKHSVNCPYCSFSPKIGWNVDLKASELKSLVIRGTDGGSAPSGWPRQWSSVVHSGNPVGLRPSRWDGTGHLSQVLISYFWHGGRIDLPLSAVRFREWIGGSKIKSTVFQIIPKQTFGDTVAWHIAGRGNGHGVGMCQLGAKFLGERGYTSASILKHYYPDATLAKLW